MTIWKEYVFWCFLKECFLYVSIKFLWSKVLFKACVSLLIFSLDDLSIDVSGVLVSLIYCITINFLPFVNICFMYLDVLILSTDKFIFIISYRSYPFIIM